MMPDEAAAVLSNPADLPDAQAASFVPDIAARARLYGEPILQMPSDLFIPPDALEIFLDAFEGPLDLLLYLIRRQNFNILDIPMAQVTLQYLKYVDQIRLHNLELAAEYLLMAAMLIEIKSRMLLPQRHLELDADVGDPRAELVRRLLDYEQIKVAAYALNAVPQLERDFTRPQLFVEQSNIPTWPEVDAADLQRAWLDVIKRSKLTQHHRISRQELSVREHMSSILRQLQSSRFVEFGDLFAGQGGVPIVVVHFVAMLELAKETLIEITQAEPFAPIYVRLAYSPV
ncbi:segregation and condensation protein A [Massilia psychrophila]|uniref:Segregation and condensation protein A n=1 Tax=Massilia psychrophila TaxID=1603353 RepID=A0A2G8SZV1_9BURK|nr:ScpA family protein [Massilia psychrophila]PIL39335.1 segregation/condensation protein A [Massilia psychrophila]GGE71765.1 segregation and condensation protein A [Massilia psychrophila]